MKSRKEIKNKAKDLLGRAIFGNKWLYLLLAILVTSLIVGVLSSFLVGIILYGVFLIGLHRVLIGVAREEDERANFNKLFSGFSDNQFVDNMLLGILQELFLFFWTLLFIIPGIIKSYAYAMSYYIKIDHPELSANECITASRKMMKGHKWQLFVIDLSFIGWYILGFLALGIGVLWVHPYHELTKALFYEELKGQQELAPAVAEAK